MSNPQYIFLTGFMGCGKSTAGKKLSKLLQATFIDLDFYIEQKEKLSVQSIFENFGESIFRKMEQKSLLELFTLKNRTVIALGGGTVCYEDNLERIKENGLLIFIDLPPAALAERLTKSKNNRPLIKNFKGGNLLQFITNKLNERLFFYKQAHITISGINLTPQLIQKEISNYVQ